ncbi:MAG: arylsulfatase A-like enzyme [Planctomycetota bacterium]|jgi:arylsulfatase A-like enzyme
MQILGLPADFVAATAAGFENEGPPAPPTPPTRSSCMSQTFTPAKRLRVKRLRVKRLRVKRLRVKRLRVSFAVLAFALLGMGSPAAEPTGSREELHPQTEASSRPNIILFLVDDMGWQDTSVPFWEQATEFNAHYKTPNMERLAASGVRFTQSYSCAVCSPTRTSLMTGQNAARHRVTQWTRTGNDPSGKTERLKSPADWNVRGLQPGLPTLPHLLRDVGYRTIHVGKAHWGTVGTPGADPTQLGFDRNIAGHSAGAPGSYQGVAKYGRAKPDWSVPGMESFHGLPIHLTDALTVRAIDEMEQSVAEQKPFYLYMAHYAVHTPIQPHEPYSQHYREAGVNETEARYAGMVQGMDASLGALLDAVDRLEVARNTIVVFTSDNGGLSAIARGKTPRDTGKDTHNWPLRSGKGSAYEGGTRVPMIVSWARPDAESPSQAQIPVPAGEVRSTPTMVEDLFPTLLAWGGAEASTADPIDGLDFTKLLTSDDPGRASERPLLFHYPHVWGPKGPGYEPHSAIRLGDWKLIYFYQPKRFELYDLSTDLGETQDLAASHPEQLNELAKRLRTDLAALGAQWPTQRETGEPEAPAWP